MLQGQFYLLFLETSKSKNEKTFAFFIEKLMKTYKKIVSLIKDLNE
jgi:hypothetical protein